jgi:nitrite reductase/ring-hydroxylating ferredoxin subunit
MDAEGAPPHVACAGEAATWRPCEARRLAVGPVPAVVVRVGDRFCALVDRCPHQGASLAAGRVTGTTLPGAVGEHRWGRQGEILKCPWHGWEFDLLTGRSLCDPPGARVRVLDVQVRDGLVWVRAGPPAPGH